MNKTESQTKHNLEQFLLRGVLPSGTVAPDIGHHDLSIADKYRAPIKRGSTDE